MNKQAYVGWLKATLEAERCAPPSTHLSVTREQAARTKADAIADLERDLYAAENGLPVPGLGGDII